MLASMSMCPGSEHCLGSMYHTIALSRLWCDVNGGYIYEKGGMVKPVADMDALPDEHEHRVVDEEQLEILERIVAEYLSEDERLVLELRRNGATLKQMRDLLGMAPSSVINRTVDAVVDVVKFFVQHVEVLDAEQDPILRAYARGKTFDTIASEVGISVSTVKRRLSVSMLNSPHCEVYEGVRRIRTRVRARMTKKEDRVAGKNWRDKFRDLIMERVGRVWYVWGGQTLFNNVSNQYVDGSYSGEADCSGLVLEVLKNVDVLPKTFPDMTAHDLRKHFAHTTKPEPGDLAFYGRPRRVTHVMFYLGHVEALNSEQCVVGMCGGGRSGMTYEQARLLGVGCWIRTSPRYRSGFLGYHKVQ